MSFFFIEQQLETAKKDLKGLSPDFLRRHSCAVCPLDNVKCENPKMPPAGSDKPDVLILGEAPTKQDDEDGEHFAGKIGRLVRSRVPGDFRNRVRWSFAVRCSPRLSRQPQSAPGPVETTCCYPKLEQDVGDTKPKAIFTFGAAPFNQISGRTDQLAVWRGRRFPAIVGGHACWVFPMWDPGAVNARMQFYGGEEDHTAFDFDLRRAFGAVDNLGDPLVHSVDHATAAITHLYDLKEIADALATAASAKTAGLDFETNRLRPYDAGARILSCAVSTAGGTFAFPVDHPDHHWADLDRKYLDKLLKAFFHESQCRKIVHNLPFELEWIGAFYGASCFYASAWECSMSQAYILDPRRGGLSLDFLAFQYFGINLKAIAGLDRANLEAAPVESVLKYNGTDARYHRLLHLEQIRRIREEGLEDVYEHQMRRLFALVLAQLSGVPVDAKTVAALRHKYEAKSAKAVKAIDADDAVRKFEQVKGRKFNPASSHDVGFLIKDVLKLAVESTAKDELATIDHPIAKLVVDHREAEKVLSTYILPLDEMTEECVVFDDHMLHPVISTTRTITWRTSSDSPNIQNFPKHDELRKEVRSQIRSPDADMRVVSFDYAGIQARNVAMESRDARLIEVFRTGYNIHADWRDRILKHYPKWIPKSKRNDEVTLAKYRQTAKNKFVFATFFGATSYTTSTGLGIPQEVCEDLKHEFFAEFPGIKRWHEGLDKFYRKYGYVTGLSGFRRYAPVSANERINTPIQSDESIIVMDAMCRLSEMEDPRYQPAMMIHDDLTFFWPKAEIDKRAEVVVKAMLSCPFEWANIVPLGVEASVGEDWLNQKRFGEWSNAGGEIKGG